MIFDKDSILREQSETEDKAQGEASNSLAPDTQKKGVEFSDSPKRPEGLGKDSSDSNEDK